MMSRYHRCRWRMMGHNIFADIVYTGADGTTTIMSSVRCQIVHGFIALLVVLVIFPGAFAELLLVVLLRLWFWLALIFQWYFQIVLGCMVHHYGWLWVEYRWWAGRWWWCAWQFWQRWTFNRWWFHYWHHSAQHIGRSVQLRWWRWRWEKCATVAALINARIWTGWWCSVLDGPSRFG